MTTYVARHSFAALLVWSGNALHGSAVKLHSLGRKVDAWLANRERAAKDRVALSHMSDRELHDIGISRASVGPVSSGHWLRDY
jgi:uncharacterized protein YjiS (DUF1127 family)